VTPTSFDGLGLSEPLRLALRGENYLKPTPIQAQAIPLLTEGRDLLGIAQTGTGKTAAFALPILHRLSIQRLSRTPGRPHALILAPTRELARQIEDRFRAYGRKLSLRSAVIFGGVGQGPQVKALAQGTDILIATPGRLLDLYAQGHVSLDRISILVLDEADRMLDMGFIRDVRKIVAACPRQRQTLLFSATMPPDIAKLAAEILRNPVRIDVSPAKVTVDRIDQRVYFVPTHGKRDLLTELLADPEMERVLVFTRTKHGADKVCKFLRQSGVATEALHGNKAQNARVRALEAFRSGQARILVATDIAARGIDVPGISHVINYELPNEPESYVHRIGRTARAGAAGAALSFCDQSERLYLKDIEKLTRVALAVAGHRQAEPGRVEIASKRWRPEHSLAAAASRRSGRPNGRRANALPSTRSAVARPRIARASLSGETR
jgi:ATP-dependent RNA helicase RhlE